MWHRRGRKPIPENLRQQMLRVDRNYKRKRKYRLKRMAEFFTEYEKICKKYNCFIDSLSGHWVKYASKEDKIFILKDYLESVKRRLDNE